MADRLAKFLMEQAARIPYGEHVSLHIDSMGEMGNVRKGIVPHISLSSSSEILKNGNPWPIEDDQSVEQAIVATIDHLCDEHKDSAISLSFNEKQLLACEVVIELARGQSDISDTIDQLPKELQFVAERFIEFLEDGGILYSASASAEDSRSRTP